MADLATWALVDFFTVRQAACLWVGAEPKENLWFPSGAQKDQIAAIEQMLTGAIQFGVLHADASANPLKLIGDHSKTVVTRGALRAFAESKNQRPDFLFNTLLSQNPNVIAGSSGALVPLSEDDLDAYLRLDTWTLTEALFILSGNRPPGYESSSELMSHFMDAYRLAVNSIKSGNLCREIVVAGERRFIESPTRWFSWAERKNLHVAEAVRAKMIRGESVDEKADAPAQGTPGSGTQSSPSVSVEEKKDVPAQGASGSGTQSSQKRRRGGAKPGPYYSKLKKFMVFLHMNGSEKFENGTPAELRSLVELRFKNDGVLKYPKTRSGLDKAIAKAKQEVIDSADRL